MNSAWIVRRTISHIKPQTSRKTVNSAIAATVFGFRKFSAGTVSNMKIVQFSYKNNPNEIRVGYLDKDNVVDLNKAIPDLPTTLLEILKKGELDKVLSSCKCSSSPVKEPLSNVLLKAPITGMDKVLCIGLNYKDHCEEQKLTPPEVPMIFSKFASTVIGPSDAVKLRTDVTDKVDWEVELALVIGKKASMVKAANAFDYILGYTVAQDISARDWQKARNGGQFLLGKSMDTFCPIGPCIATADEVNDPQKLAIKCSINGVIKQTSRTDQLVHKIPDVIERLTSVMTLYPGDILLTGTPGGVGMYRSPPEYLKPGDVIHSEIENIGILETRIEKF
ncbi:fumarylacetoacetate hydrolase domain-containing protein 2-like [Zerene cesonia]|uniref:fumarylacetoacetate hydrolase domain-containing protein 2-like n=1 Tax=Zerene cesonia TaxID=33412 RepID=UPI0018E4E7BD|nr:fumarylacetoacetate hydrolase domain-containing protein 2-like [Zerene cesonia]